MHPAIAILWTIFVNVLDVKAYDCMNYWYGTVVDMSVTSASGCSIGACWSFLSTYGETAPTHSGSTPAKTSTCKVLTEGGYPTSWENSYAAPMQSFHTKKYDLRQKLGDGRIDVCQTSDGTCNLVRKEYIGVKKSKKNKGDVKVCRCGYATVLMRVFKNGKHKTKTVEESDCKMTELDSRLQAAYGTLGKSGLQQGNKNVHCDKSKEENTKNCRCEDMTKPGDSSTKTWTSDCEWDVDLTKQSSALIDSTRFWENY